jgi:hypothetical protein
MGTGQANTGATYSFGIINTTQLSAGVGTQEIAKINLGKGFNVGLNFGYIFNKNIGVELGASYLMGAKTNTAITSYTGDYRYNEISVKMIVIKPTIVFRAGFDKLNRYAKIGMVIDSGKITLSNSFKEGANTANST